MKSRSGSRSVANPKTKAQKLTRVAELTERIDRRQAEVEDLARERATVVQSLRDEDPPVSLREIGDAMGKSPQAAHKLLNGHKR